VTGVIKLDPWLEPFKETIKYRFNETQKWIKKIDDTEGGLEVFSRVYAVSIIDETNADR
jgi:1,4-alpha-glucan branching enzyme